MRETGGYFDFQREERRKAQAKYRKTTLYGITQEQLDRLWNLQGGKCAICEIHLESNKYVIDHSHSTGCVRGILCYNCNKAISLEMAGLVKAIQYLDNPPFLEMEG